MNEVKLSFLDGVKVEINGDDLTTEYAIEFLNASTGVSVYQTTITSGHWSMPNLRYYVPWRVVVKADEDVVLDETLDLKDKPVLVSIESKSLGDNVGWMPIVEEFRKKHGCRMTVTSFKNKLYSTEYPDIEFRAPGTPLDGFFAWYRLGAFDDDYNRNKTNWRLVPLQRIASDILGLEPVDVQPRVRRSSLPPSVNRPYIAIGEFSTYYTKQWIRPNGWRQLVEKVRELGFETMSICKEPTTLPNVLKRNMQPIEETIRNIQYAKAFVTVSTGPSLLAWALGVPVVIVSGCTAPWSEFSSAKRITGNASCRGCFNNLHYQLERGNWRFCPAGRDFECSRTITVEEVFAQLEPILSDMAAAAPPEYHTTRILQLSPHCSTGGGPQYLLRCVELARELGMEVQVVEYRNISNDYTVQRKQLQALAPYHILNGDKTETLKRVIAEYRPDVIHVQEFPENFMDEGCADWLYRKDRDYRIVETAHGVSIGPDKKRWKPDAFAFVSKFHLNLFKDTGIPARVVEYVLPKRIRPDRTEALKKLGLNPSQKHILNIGLFSPHKNQGEVFEIASYLPEFQFHFIGNTADNYRPYWEPLLAEKPTNCTVWGERSDVDDFYAAMDLFLFTSMTELNPLVIKEAVSWSMPVFMRNLPAYCGVYDSEPLVTFIDDNVSKTCDLLQSKFPTMADGLKSIYGLGVANPIRA